MFRKKIVANNNNVPSIPLAPIDRLPLTSADKDYKARKKALVHRLRFFTTAEVNRMKYPFHILLMHDLVAEGYFDTVQELNNLMRAEALAWAKECTIKKKGPVIVKTSFTQDKVKFKYIADSLTFCQEHIEDGDYELALRRRLEMGETFLKEGDLAMAEHFLRSGLETLPNMEESLVRDHLEAEMNCILAFIMRENYSDHLEKALEEAIEHLVICRTLTKDQTWQLKPNLLKIRLKKPITLHGLRDAYVVIEGSSMTMYLMATMLEHEMLIGLANEILHMHQRMHPTPAQLLQAHLLADLALKLAQEIRHPVALSSAMMRFGVVLMHNQEYNDAMMYFKKLVHHAEITGDEETFAIAYHSIAMCRMGQRKPVEAITSLLKQRDIAELSNMEDLEADALQELGILLLQEGQIWEAEESYACAYEAFLRAEMDHTLPKNHCDYNFAMWGVSAGLKLWSRFAGFAKRDGFDDVNVLVEWKSTRHSMPEVPRPDYNVEIAADTFAALYHPEKLTENATQPGEDFYGRSNSRVGFTGGLEKLHSSDDDDENIETDSSSVTSDNAPAEDNDEYYFASDYDRNNQFHSRLNSRRATYIHMGQSLGMALEMRGSLAFPII